VKCINKSSYLIKTDDDITIIDKYLSTCFDKKESYFLVNITDQPNRHSGMSSLSIDSWMDNI